jgi:hypothetical protein
MKANNLRRDPDRARVETEGTDDDERFVDVDADETDRAEVASGFQHVEKRVALRIWYEVTAAIDDKVLADDCGVSRSYYSKVASGAQGDLLDLVYRVGKKRPELRREFFVRLAEHEGVDPVSAAAEQMVVAALRFLRLRGLRVVKSRMAKAAL